MKSSWPFFILILLLSTACQPAPAATLDGRAIHTAAVQTLSAAAAETPTASPFPSPTVTPAAFRFASRNQMWAYIVLCVSTVVRVVWITFREPTGAARAEAAVAGRGGLAELAGLSLSAIVVIAMLSLCVMIPGIVLRKRWGYTAAAWFGALMVVLTAANVVLMVNQGSGPAVVIPSSWGMFCGAMWLRSLPAGPQPDRQKLANAA